MERGHNFIDCVAMAVPSRVMIDRGLELPVVALRLKAARMAGSGSARTSKAVRIDDTEVVASVSLDVAVPSATYEVEVRELAQAQTQPNAEVLVNGASVDTTGDVFEVAPNIRGTAKKAGKTLVAVGPIADDTPSGVGLQVLKWTKNLLRLQLLLGVFLIVAALVGGMFFGTHQPSINAQEDLATGTTLTTELDDASTTTSTTEPDGVTTVPPGAVAPPAAAVPNPALTTPGGTTSSTVSLVQALAAAGIAAGAALLPTGAASILAGKVRSQE